MILDDFEIDGHRIVADISLPALRRYLNELEPKLGPGGRICVDIGAGDGLVCSNTLFFYLQGWSGLSIEADPNRYDGLQHFYRQYLPQISLRSDRVTPINVCAILAEAEIPRQFGFLSLDIDSFDYDVLVALLNKYRPALICAEINEKIPPPLRFRVQYDPNFVYSGDHFYGMSLASLHDLAQYHHYHLLELCFNNAILIAAEQGPNNWPPKSPDAAYREGFLNQPPLDYNQNLARLQMLAPEDGLAFLQAHFADYRGLYQAGIGPA